MKYTIKSHSALILASKDVLSVSVIVLSSHDINETYFVLASFLTTLFYFLPTISITFIAISEE